MMQFETKKFLIVSFATFFIFIENTVVCHLCRNDMISESVNFDLTNGKKLFHVPAFRRGGAIVPQGGNDDNSIYDYSDNADEGIIDDINDNIGNSSRRRRNRRENTMKKREGIHTDVMENRRRRVHNKKRRPVLVAAIDKSKVKNDHEDDEEMDHDSQISCYSIKGRRNYMEDEYIIVKPSFLSSSSSSSSSKKKSGANSKNTDVHNIKQDEGLFTAIFDGHGGTAVSRYLRQNLYAQLQTALPLMHQQQIQQAKEEININDTHVISNSTYHGNKSATLSSRASDSFYIDENNLTVSRNLMHRSENFQKSMNQSNDNMLLKASMDALRYAFQKVDSQVQRISHWSFQGSTAVVAWLLPNTITSSNDIKCHRGSKLIVANVGDSRAIYIHNLNSGSSNVTQLTLDHKPNDPIERERILNVGGTVKWCGLRDAETNEPMINTGVYRINGNLALARAIGDRSEKPFVSSQVDIHTVTLPFSSSTNQDDNGDNIEDADSYEDDCIILASDGLWDVMTNEQIKIFVHEKLKFPSSTTDGVENRSDEIINPSSLRPLLSPVDEEHNQFQNMVVNRERINQLYFKQKQKARYHMAKLLVQEALKRGSTDNITIIIIWLSPMAIKN